METTKKQANSGETTPALLGKLDFMLRKAFKGIIQEAEPVSF